MAVIVECVTVVVTESALQQRYPGGVAAYREAAPNATYCSDGRISAISFIIPEDAHAFVRTLTRSGLADPWLGRSLDIAVADQSEGLLAECDWLALDLRVVLDPEGRTYPLTLAWVKGEQATTFAAPAGWKPRSSKRLTREELERNYELVRDFATDRSAGRSGAVEAYRHRQTGEMIYIGRPNVERDDSIQARYDSLAAELAVLEAQPVSRARDERLASCFERAAKLVEDSNWQEPGPLWVHGFAARLSRRWAVAEQSFRRMTELRPDILVGWLELTWALAKLDRLEEAESAARRATEVDPTSSAAFGNLASALLQRGRPTEASAAIARAIELDPLDEKNRIIQQQVQNALREAAPQTEVHTPWYKRWFS